MSSNALESVVMRGLQVLLFLLPWQTIWIYREVVIEGAKWQYGTLAFYAMEFLLWGTTVMFLIWFWKQFREKKQKTFSLTADRVFMAAVALFILYSLVSRFWSLDSQLAQQQSLHLMEMFILLIMLFVGPLSATDAAKAFLFGAGIQAVLGLWQFLSQSTFSSALLGVSMHPVVEPGTSVVAGDAIGRVLRAYGGFSHPNVFGGYMAFSLGLLLLLTWQRSGISKWFRYGFALIITAALFVTFSRSAWLAGACLVGGFLILAHISTKKAIFRTAVISVVTAMMLAGLFFPSVANRFSSDESLEIRSVEDRVLGIDQAMVLIGNHFWFGVGAGNYTASLIDQAEGQPGWAYQPVHNVPLLFVAEMGIVGTLLFIGLLCSWVWYQVTSNKYQRTMTWKEGERFVYVLFATCYLLLAIFDHYLYSSYIGLVMTGAFWGITFRFFHTSSTDGPRVMPNSAK